MKVGHPRTNPPEPVQESVVDEEEDEVSDEDDDEDEFDIDDSSPEAATLASTKITNILTSQEEIIGQEKAYDMILESSHKVPAAPVLRGDRRHKSKSRSRSRSSGLRSGIASPGRFAGPQHHPSIPTPRHVEFALGTNTPFEISESESVDTARRPGGRLSFDPRKARERLLKERGEDVEVARTPTAFSMAHGRARGQRSRSVDYHGRRAFAVWGHDESDSNDESSA